ncbi:hypothetical protein PNP85_05385 [Halobacterium salinarum]|uniref:hypothetical protein n=1 Tax=Halobacterium salinarum TaxID=2242 RepID=UPI002554FE8A|nr:hypothetical protein [Halobacterium salinarum]MDL0138933.1 hypothetical protein [Halobacterium salinarum]
MNGDTTEYSLWLTLNEKTNEHDCFQDTIVDLAVAHQDAPVFAPHVTVVGGIDVERTTLVETANSLADETEPINAMFGPLRCSTTTHQCVFRLLGPSLELFELYESARETLELSTSAYNPHLSLIYIDMSFADRLALVETIDSESLPRQARFPTLEVVETAGPVPEWETVCTAQL